MSTLSLGKRLLIAATFTLVAFLGLAGVALDRAFVASTRIAVREQLNTEVNALLTVMEIDADGRLIVPDAMPETRLASPGSGLYAAVLDQDGGLLWRSPSSVGASLDFLHAAPPGHETFMQLGDEIHHPFYYGLGIAWEIDIGREVGLTFIIIDESPHFVRVIRSYRGELVFWLGMAGLLLLVVQGVILRWGLRPLGRVMHELDRIENARQEKILGDYPREIAQLSERINLFIENERNNLVRYRNTLGDLAHSLKTPLAVIKGAVESGDQGDRALLGEHVDRMNRIVEYQLKRAASARFTVMYTTVNVGQAVARLNDSLRKVYSGKAVDASASIDPGHLFRGDENDFYELAGNVMDNAWKWAESRVMVRSAMRGEDSIRQGLVLEVHDDGPGINAARRDEVLRRGARADQHAPGQGIGLAVAGEIVERYNGRLSLSTSELGGALVRMEFPAA